MYMDHWGEPECGGVMDFEPLRVERGDGKEFWQPRVDGMLLWKIDYGSALWDERRPSRNWGRALYRSKWMARRKGKNEAKRWFSVEDTDQ